MRLLTCGILIVFFSCTNDKPDIKENSVTITEYFNYGESRNASGRGGSGYRHLQKY
jgi:hypothetical protein